MFRDLCNRMSPGNRLEDLCVCVVTLGRSKNWFELHIDATKTHQQKIITMNGAAHADILFRVLFFQMLAFFELMENELLIKVMLFYTHRCHYMFKY